MKKRTILSALLILTITVSAIPSWFTSNLTLEYPDYFIGKGFAEIQDGNIPEAENKAKLEALKDASSSISCSVSGEIINNREETESRNLTEINEYFLSETKVKTNLEIMGYEILKTKQGKKNFFVLIGVPEKDLLNSFKNKIKNSIKEIFDNFVLAEELTDSNPEQSIRKYEQCAYQTGVLQDDLQIYLFLNNWQNDFRNDISKLPSQSKIENKLILLADTTPKSTEILASQLLEPFLHKQFVNYSYVFYPFEYQNTGFVSNFGKNFAEICSNLIQDENRRRRIPFKRYQEADKIFRGKIIESDNGMFLTLTMESLNKGDLKSNQLFVNKTTCENIGWHRIKPENLESALKNKIALYNAIQTDNNLKVDIQTDKMSDGPVIYYYEEEPKIFIRTNKVCFIRLMYIFADGTKTLLSENYPISNDQANQWIQIPFEGVICEPSGVEQLILQASTERQPHINYRREDLGSGNYINIIEKEISSQIAKTRGIKLKNPKKEITEKVYQWTIFEK